MTEASVVLSPPLQRVTLPAGDLRALGQSALDAFGVRLVVLFFGSAVVGVLLIGGTQHWTLVLSLAGLTALSAVLLVPGLTRQSAPTWLASAVLVTCLTLAIVAVATSRLGDARTSEVVAWMLAGVGSGLSVSRGPWWGGLAFAVSAAVTIGVGLVAGGPVSPAAIPGAFTYYVGGVVICIAARRGFAATQRALEVAEAAETAHTVAVERWTARRAADQALHDTVLATLTLLAHGGTGVPMAGLRARCEHAAQLLSSSPGVPSPLPAVAQPADREDIATWLRRVAAEATDTVLEVTVHSSGTDLEMTRLSPAAASALSGAVAQCLANVQRHAQTLAVELAVSESPDQLTVVVLDRGQGFDPAAVSTERLGLRLSVVERLAAVGGNTTIWSRPGLGTSVVLRVPIASAAHPDHGDDLGASP